MLRMTGIRVVVILSVAKDLYTSIKCRGSAIGALHHSTRHAHSSPFFAFILAYTAVGRPYSVMKPSDQVWS